MFPRRFFPGRMFAPRYFPQAVGAVVVFVNGPLIFPAAQNYQRGAVAAGIYQRGAVAGESR